MFAQLAELVHLTANTVCNLVIRDLKPPAARDSSPSVSLEP